MNPIQTTPSNPAAVTKPQNGNLRGTLSLDRRQALQTPSAAAAMASSPADLIVLDDRVEAAAVKVQLEVEEPAARS